MLALAAGLIALLALNLAPSNPLFYYPYPPYPLMPDFNPAIALLFALPLLPALALPKPQRNATSNLEP